MLEKAELTLIKMLSKTKKVITTPPPVLCSIASCNYYFTEVEDCEYFHYYLCRQLKGGGMEIKMKKMKKMLAVCLTVVMVAATAVGCGKFDAEGYVAACLDLLTKGETEQYTKLTGRTEEQAEQDYENNIDAMMEAMGELNLSEDLENNYRTLYKDIYKSAKYTVTGSEKMTDKDGYTVTVEIEQITGLFDGLEDEVTNRVMNEKDSLTPDITEAEVNELVFQIMYDVLNERMDAITYNEPETVTVEVVGEDGVYSITEEGYTILDDALIDTAGM